MTVNGSASSLGVACGGAVGGLVLAFADYWALGVVGMTCLLTAAVLLWSTRPSAASVSASAAS
jgi:predicted MFS family arabinose efflux permease